MANDRQYQKKSVGVTSKPQTPTRTISSANQENELQGAIGNREMGRLIETHRQNHPSSLNPNNPGEMPLLGGMMPVSQGRIQRQPLFRGLSEEMRRENDTLTLPESGAAVQRKLTLGTVGDVYEQEADRVARQVVDEIHSSPFRASDYTSEGERIADDGEPGRVQRQITVRGLGVAGGELSSEWEGELQRAKGGGQPLSPTVREQMGQAFGADFGGVRVHTGEQADMLARSIQAKAFTTGQDVFFRQGAYEPGSRGGQELIAHELTHVVQQSEELGDTEQQEKNGNTDEQTRSPEAESSQAKGSDLKPRVIQRSVIEFTSDTYEMKPPLATLIDAMNSKCTTMEQKDYVVLLNEYLKKQIKVKSTVPIRVPKFVYAIIEGPHDPDETPPRQGSAQRIVGNMGTDEYKLRTGDLEGSEAYEGGHLISHSLWNLNDQDSLLKYMDAYENLVPMSRDLNVNQWGQIEKQLDWWFGKWQKTVPPKLAEIHIKMDRGKYIMTKEVLSRLLKTDINAIPQIEDFEVKAMTPGIEGISVTHIDGMGEVTDRQVGERQTRRYDEIKTWDDFYGFLLDIGAWARLHPYVRRGIEEQIEKHGEAWIDIED